ADGGGDKDAITPDNGACVRKARNLRLPEDVFARFGVPFHRRRFAFGDARCLRAAKLRPMLRRDFGREQKQRGAEQKYKIRSFHCPSAFLTSSLLKVVSDPFGCLSVIAVTFSPSRAKVKLMPSISAALKTCFAAGTS